MSFNRWLPLIVLFVAGLGLMLVLPQVSKRQVIQQDAAFTGTVDLKLVPHVSTFVAGEQFVVDVILDTAGQANPMSAVSARINYLHPNINVNDVEIVFDKMLVPEVDPSVDTDVTEGWNYPFVEVNKADKVIDFSLVNLSHLGFSAQSPLLLMRLFVTIDTPGTMMFEFDTENTIVTDKVTAANVLDPNQAILTLTIQDPATVTLTPTPAGGTNTPTPVATGTIAPTATVAPTATPTGGVGGPGGTNTPTPNPTATKTPTPNPSIGATATPTSTVNSTPTPTGTLTPTVTTGAGTATPTSGVTGTPTAVPTLGADSEVSMMIRYQGVTEERFDTYADVMFLAGTGEVMSFPQQKFVSNVNGAYTSNFVVPAGTYSVVINGHAHLQKIYTGVVVNGQTSLNWTLVEDDWLLAGDVDHNNQIDITDLGLILSMYTDLQVPVPAGSSVDLDFSEAVTVLDVALALVHYYRVAELEIRGDELSDSYTVGDAIVEEVVVSAGSFSEYMVDVSGNLPDGCTHLYKVGRNWFGGSVISYMMKTIRLQSAICTQALVNFDERLSLDTTTLETGAYTVTVNGVSDEFSL